MLEQYFLRPTTVDRIRLNWLAPQTEQYVEWMHAQEERVPTEWETRCRLTYRVLYLTCDLSL
jgi:hypothetical protein